MHYSLSRDTFVCCKLRAKRTARLFATCYDKCAGEKDRPLALFARVAHSLVSGFDGEPVQAVCTFISAFLFFAPPRRKQRAPHGCGKKQRREARAELMMKPRDLARQFRVGIVYTRLTAP